MATTTQCCQVHVQCNCVGYSDSFTQHEVYSYSFGKHTFPSLDRSSRGHTAASRSSREQHSRLTSGNGSVRAAARTAHASPATCGNPHPPQACVNRSSVAALSRKLCFPRQSFQRWKFLLTVSSQSRVNRCANRKHESNRMKHISAHTQPEGRHCPKVFHGGFKTKTCTARAAKV